MPYYEIRMAEVTPPISTLLRVIEERLERSKHKPWTNNIHELVVHLPTDLAKLIAAIKILDEALGEIITNTFYTDEIEHIRPTAEDARARTAEILK